MDTQAKSQVTARPNQDLVDMVVVDFPRPLKRALVRAAVAERSNMTNVAVAALAAEFGVKFVPTERRWGSKPGASDKVSFAMPRVLRRRIRRYADDHDMNRRDVVIEKLTEAMRAGGHMK